MTITVIPPRRSVRTFRNPVRQILVMLLGLAFARPVDATVILVAGNGTALGSTTTYTCTQFPQSPPNCPSTTTPGTFDFYIPVSVDTDALAIAPVSFSDVQIGIFYFADFTIALVGTDQWGNYLFQGQDLFIQGTSNLHPCFNGVYPCTGDRSTYFASTFPIQQVSPAAVPEPATWSSMLLGFLSVGWLLRLKRFRRRSLNSL